MASRKALLIVTVILSLILIADKVEISILLIIVFNS